MKKAFHLISPFFIFVLFPLPETYLKKKTTISMSDVRKFNCLCNPLEVSCYQILRLYLYNLFEFIFVHGVTEHVQLLSHVRLRNSMGCRLSEIFLARIWKSVAISSFKGYSWFDPWVSCTGRWFLENWATHQESPIEKSSFIHLHVAVQFSKTLYQKSCFLPFFLCYIFLAPLSLINCPYKRGPFLGPLFCSIELCVCLYACTRLPKQIA